MTKEQLARWRELGFEFPAFYDAVAKEEVVKNNEKEEAIIEDFKKSKIKVNLTVGMFFDGTGNNKRNSEEIYYKNLNNKNIFDKKIPKKYPVKFDKDVIEINSVDSYWNPYSNVALLFDLYETKIENKKLITNVVLKQYIQGIGTDELKKDDIAGSAFGEGKNGIIGKLTEGCTKLAIQISDFLEKNKNSEIDSITFDVFGFSRGAAAARHFCNDVLKTIDLLEKNKIVNEKPSLVVNENIPKPKKVKFLPKNKQYTLGVLGDALKKEEVAFNLVEDITTSTKVTIRFLGLFDTVVSQMVIKNHIGKKFDLASPVTRIPYGVGTFIETTLDVVKQRIDNLNIQNIVHLTASDEYRANFASTKINFEKIKQKINKEKSNRKVIEYPMKGAHSDIGGGYAALALEEDIIDFIYDSFTAGEEIVPTRLIELKNWLVEKGYANNEEIKVIEAKRKTQAASGNIAITEILFQLKAKRKFVPRYSIIPMYVMRDLALSCDVPLTLDPKTRKFPFEYLMPKELEKYAKEQIETAKALFENKKTKKPKYQLTKSKFIHLSSNYNLSRGIEKSGAPITISKALDRLFYVNAPNYENGNENSYLREIYTHNNK